jgi:hypothetical protein
MSVCVYSVFMLSCVGSGLATGWSPFQRVLPTVHRITKLTKEGGHDPTKGYRAIDEWMIITWLKMLQITFRLNPVMTENFCSPPHLLQENISGLFYDKPQRLPFMLFPAQHAQPSYCLKLRKWWSWNRPLSIAGRNVSCVRFNVTRNVTQIFRQYSRLPDRHSNRVDANWLQIRQRKWQIRMLMAKY